MRVNQFNTKNPFNFFLVVVCAFVLTACKNFQNEDQGKLMARVNDHYLYQKDLEQLIPGDFSIEDSSDYRFAINRWAVKMLMLDQANLNLKDEKKEKFEKLVQDYHENLLVSAYSELMVSKTIDTAISRKQIKNYYANHTHNLSLRENWMKIRYVALKPNFPDLIKIKSRFARYNESDSSYFKAGVNKFQDSFLGDSTWVRQSSIEKRLKAFASANKTILLPVEKGLFTLKNKNTVVLGVMKEILERSEKAPLSLVKTKVKQIILNQRKLSAKKELKKDIIKDAIENGKFEPQN
jgi:hypothetical protein